MKIWEAVMAGGIALLIYLTVIGGMLYGACMIVKAVFFNEC